MNTLWTNFKLQCRNQVRVQDTSQMEHSSFRSSSSSSTCTTPKQERPKKKRGRKQKSLQHYGEMRKHKAPWTLQTEIGISRGYSPIPVPKVKQKWDVILSWFLFSLTATWNQDPIPLPIPPTREPSNSSSSPVPFVKAVPIRFKEPKP